MSAILTAPLTVEFPFTRSVGPVQSAFLTGLREQVLLGVRTGDGRVLVPLSSTTPSPPRRSAISSRSRPPAP